MDLNTAIDVIESCDGFTDESTPVGEAWAVVLNYIYLRRMDKENRKPSGGYVSEQLDRELDDSPIPTSGIYRASKRIRVKNSSPLPLFPSTDDGGTFLSAEQRNELASLLAAMIDCVDQSTDAVDTISDCLDHRVWAEQIQKCCDIIGCSDELLATARHVLKELQPPYSQ
jgi:hypothetical protein